MGKHGIPKKRKTYLLTVENLNKLEKVYNNFKIPRSAQVDMALTAFFEKNKKKFEIN